MLWILLYRQSKRKEKKNYASSILYLKAVNLLVSSQGKHTVLWHLCVFWVYVLKTFCPSACFLSENGERFEIKSNLWSL